MWHVEVKLFFIETGEVNKKGNPIRRPVTHRKLFLHDPKAIFDSGYYRIVCRKHKVVRDGVPTTEHKYTISIVPRTRQPIWQNPNGKPEVWYKLARNGDNFAYKRSDDPAMNEMDIRRWLTIRIGETQAKIAIETLLTAEPDNLAEAA